jgi:hypothetical protein
LKVQIFLGLQKIHGKFGSGCLPEKDSEVNLQTGKKSDGDLPARMQCIRDTMKTLDKNGKYHLSFRIICSISIAVSASGFLPDDKGSIPLWSTKCGLNTEHLTHNQGPVFKIKVKIS